MFIALKSTSMPVSEMDLIRGGFLDWKMDNLTISKHAIQRCKERHISLEDLRRNHGNQAGFGIIKNNVVVTALNNSMKSRPPPPTPKKISVDSVKKEIRKRKEAIGLCQSIKTKHPDHYTYFWNLFQHHPTGMGKRVKEIVELSLVKQSVRKRENKDCHNASDLMFVVSYEDGKKDTISISKCIEPYIASSDQNSQIPPPLAQSASVSLQS